MEEKGIHYRIGGNLTHCGCECLPGGKDIEYIIIEKIDYVSETKINGRTEQNVWIATFAKNPYTKLPMVLNSTNRKRLAKLYPDCDGYINLLKDVPVRLTREKCRDIQDGGETWGLRISRTPAKKPSKQPLTKENKLIWDQAVNFIKSGNSLAKIKEKYDISQEVETQLIKEAQA